MLPFGNFNFCFVRYHIYVPNLLKLGIDVFLSIYDSFIPMLFIGFLTYEHHSNNHFTMSNLSIIVFVVKLINMEFKIK